jgi:hypothetical protein
MKVTWSQSYQTFFFIKRRFFLFFTIKLGHFIAQTILPYAKNTQEKQRSQIYIGLTPGLDNHIQLLFQESILPIFILLRFPILAVNFTKFVTEENNPSTIKWLGLRA